MQYLSQSVLRKKERAKYTKWYFENMYWVEDFPKGKHYKKFDYNDPTHEKRFRYLTEILIKHFKFKNALDVGCGMGHVVRNLLRRGYKVRGVEVSEDALKFYMPDFKRKGVVVEGAADELPFKDNQFDLVFSSDVMEHIPKFDLSASVAELVRVCRKYLVLTINLDHPYKYHPSILPRETWHRMFLSTKKLRRLSGLEQRIEKETKKRYSEYDWFVFQKLSRD